MATGPVFSLSSVPTSGQPDKLARIRPVAVAGSSCKEALTRNVLWGPAGRGPGRDRPGMSPAGPFIHRSGARGQRRPAIARTCSPDHEPGPASVRAGSARWPACFLRHRTSSRASTGPPSTTPSPITTTCRGCCTASRSPVTSRPASAATPALCARGDASSYSSLAAA
jgi:hypothetical protein